MFRHTGTQADAGARSASHSTSKDAIVTPEPEYAPPEWYATAWRRFWAGFIDGFVFQPLLWLNDWIWSAFHTPLLLVPWFVFFATSFVAYSVLFHWRWGQTLGKRVTGVRVHSLTGSPLSLRQAAMRDIFPLMAGIVGVLVSLPQVAHGKSPYPDAAAGLAGLSTFQIVMFGSMWVWWILEVTTMLFNSKRRALHDFIAGTVVMRVSQPAL
jgi:uncharacterized RDD family membrane protein YckC